jgi:hypothetical protein
MEGVLRAMPVRAIQRRRSTAALIGLLVFLALGVITLVLLGLRGAPQPMAGVLRANREIRPGSTIGAGDMGVTYLYAQDPAVLATLSKDTDRNRLVGQVALVDVATGALIPADIAVPAASAGIWKASVPVKRMPAGLKPGDHVAVMAQGSQGGGDVDVVVMQDVVVLNVASGLVDLWLPAKAAPQIEWDADHGGIVLLAMQPGAVQSPLPVGGSG